jgi:ribosomal protein S18 acetylase RimI-like enzyme
MLKRILLMGIIGGAVVVSGYMIWQRWNTAPIIVREVAPGVTISEYNPLQDRDEIVDFFNVERYWLLFSADFSAEYMLDYRTPSMEETDYKGMLHVKVLRDHGKFCGFVAYFKKNFQVGNIRFLGVKRECRGRGFGSLLLNQALDDFKKMGLKKAQLYTRVTNKVAQALYKKHGFVIIQQDEHQLTLEKSLV